MTKFYDKGLGNWRLDVLEAGVGVDDEEGAEDGVGEGVQGAGRKGSDGEGNEACGDNSGGWMLALA